MQRQTCSIDPKIEIWLTANKADLEVPVKDPQSRVLNLVNVSHEVKQLIVQQTQSE